MAQQTFNLPYRETPYQVTATRKFYHPQTKTVSINPTTPNPNLSFELVRKTGEWIYTEDSEVLPYGRTVVEDINVEEEDSYISEPGVDGLREFSEEREWIDGEWTGEVRNVTETITQPVDEIYIQGTGIITWVSKIKRTEAIPFETVEYESSDYYIGETVVTQHGVEGVRSYWSAQKYLNGQPKVPFEWGSNEIPEVTTQPITHRIAIGTKPIGVTVTAYIYLVVGDVSTIIYLIPFSGAIVGKEIIRIELEEGVQANGSWTLDNSSSQFSRIHLGGEASQIFGNLPRLYNENEPIQLTYIP